MEDFEMSEKLAILKMVEEGKITVEEASKLLETVEGKKENFSIITKEIGKTAKWLKIKVVDDNEDTKVNVNVPIALIDVALKIAKASSNDFDIKLGSLNIDIENIVKMIQEGAEGKIVDIESDGTKVEIVVE